VDFNINNSLASVLGFDKILLNDGEHMSTKLVDIMDITLLKVMVNTIEGSYNNGQTEGAIYTFFPGVAPGYKIMEKPANPIYLPVSTQKITTFNVSLVDQDNKPVDLRGEDLNIRFHIREF